MLNKIELGKVFKIKVEKFKILKIKKKKWRSLY